tara:strand:- start:1813 stop:2031 length:219 start_codon:yes stop_codon:yes gene_type:complete
MQNHAIHNTVAVRITNNHNQYALDWADEDGNNKSHICYVFGFENAVRVANGIAHEQVEFVKHPCFDPNEVAA